MGKGSPGIQVTEGDLCSSDRWFKSQHRILDGHFSHYIVVKTVMPVWKDRKNKQKRGRGCPIKKIWEKTDIQVPTRWPLPITTPCVPLFLSSASLMWTMLMKMWGNFQLFLMRSRKKERTKEDKLRTPTFSIPTGSSPQGVYLVDYVPKHRLHINYSSLWLSIN